MVDIKLNQQWIANCDELRALHSRMLILQISEIRKTQVDDIQVQKQKDVEREKRNISMHS